MTDRGYPVSNHRLKRRAVALRKALEEAQRVVRENGSNPKTGRVLMAAALLTEHGVLPTDQLEARRARLWNWRVYRDPAG